MKVLFLGGFAASQIEWIAPVIESDVEIATVVDERDTETLAPALRDTDIVVSDLWRAGLPAAPRLKLLQAPVAGTDMIDRAALPSGVTICNAYGHEIPMAEYAVMAMLVWCHRYFEIAIAFRGGSWRDSGVTSGPFHRELRGLTVGIVDLGRLPCGCLQPQHWRAPARCRAVVFAHRSRSHAAALRHRRAVRRSRAGNTRPNRRAPLGADEARRVPDQCRAGTGRG